MSEELLNTSIKDVMADEELRSMIICSGNETGTQVNFDIENGLPEKITGLEQ